MLFKHGCSLIRHEIQMYRERLGEVAQMGQALADPNFYAKRSNDRKFPLNKCTLKCWIPQRARFLPFSQSRKNGTATFAERLIGHFLFSFC